MNIFKLDNNPEVAARYLANIHVNKMVIESAQMLANAFSLEQLQDPTCPTTQKGTPRGHSYLHHPCSQWVLQSEANYLWLAQHALAIAYEYTLRYEKRHFTEDFLWWAMYRWVDAQNLNHDNKELTEFAVAIAPTSKAYPLIQNMTDVVDKYRTYYRLDKAHMAVWTVRDIPPFMLENQISLRCGYMTKEYTKALANLDKEGRPADGYTDDIIKAAQRYIDVNRSK